MKVWIKALVGSLLGLLLGFLLPANNQMLENLIPWLWEFAIHIGRYITVPILFFALTIAVYELRQDNQFWPLVLKTFIVIILGTLAMIAAGMLITFIFLPARIPIFMEEQREMVSLGLAGGIMGLFPSNAFSVLTAPGLFLLPACVLAFFLGMGLSYDRHYTKQVISIVDSLSRIFYHVASFFSEILGLIIIFIGVYWAVRFREALRADVFRDLILLLGIFSLVMGLVIMPAFLYLLKPKINPWRVLYGSLGPAVAAFFSGDINFTLPVLFRHVKENLGVRRRVNTVSITLITHFGRAGSVTIAAMAFIVIINSYSSLGVTIFDVFSIAVRVLLISFFLTQHSGSGAHTALAVLCVGFGRGFEAGYLILQPIAFYLIAMGAFLDIMFASFASFAIARIGGFQEDKEIRHFI